MTARFDETNTEGYTAEQLAWANAEWDERYSDIDPDSEVGRTIQERILIDAENIDA